METRNLHHRGSGLLRRMTALVLALCLCMGLVPAALSAESVGNTPAALTRSANKVFIQVPASGYGSMYGNTAAAAEALAEELRRQGVPCAVHDLAGNVNPGLGLSGALRDVFKYDTIVAASPTYNNGIFPPVETFMKALQARLIKGRRFYALGSYTWAGSSVNLLNSFV